MYKKLIKKLEQVREALAKNSLSLPNLEKMQVEVREEFESLISGLVAKRDVLKEMLEKRAELLSWKISAFKTLYPPRLRHFLSVPFIYAVFFPVVIVHIFLELYHQICFRLYGIPLVRSQDYFIYDRQLLPYLNWVEKINCLYCSYVNNFFQYAVEIAGRTERYWCPIKYARRKSGQHSQYDKFFDYLDAEHFRGEWQKLRGYEEMRPGAVCRLEDKDKKE